MLRPAPSLALIGILWAAPAAPADPWLQVRTTHFELFTTSGERDGRDMIRHFEQVRNFFLHAFGMKSTAEKPVRIIAFRSDKEFQPYRPSEAATAFYHSGAEHNCIVMSGADSAQYRVATHEYTHLLISQIDGVVPIWLNEGLAELYSTLEQSGDKIQVGMPPPGRGRNLAEEPWIPLAAVLSVDSNSPLYNEKSRAGMFYAESWALVHMLNLDHEYRPHLGAMLDALKTEESAAAFEKAYGKTVSQVQADLVAYVHRDTLHGAAFPSSAAKSQEEVKVVTHAGMQARLALAEMLAEYPGKFAQAATMYAQLEHDFAGRWEVEAALGRFDFSERRNREAVAHFTRAAALGANDPYMFLTYASALNGAARPDEAVKALRTAIHFDVSLKEAHYDLGLALLRTAEWRDAMYELQLARPVTKQQASRYFYGMAYSTYRLGDLISARNYVEQGRGYTRIPEEVSALNGLSASLGPPVVDGILDGVDCEGKAARIHVRVKDADRLFLIPDFTAAKNFTCGSTSEVPVHLEFQAMPTGKTGADGIVRSLELK